MKKIGLVLIFATACGGGEKNEGPVAMLSGMLQPDDCSDEKDNDNDGLMDSDDVDCSSGPLEAGGDYSAEFTGYRAFGFDDQGTLGVYISSNENATCELVTEYLKSDGSFDPSDVIYPGRCNLFIKVSGFENGTFQASNDSVASAASAIECAMGSGEILYTTLDVGDQGYYWTGKWWQGTPKVYEWNFTGDRSESYSLEITMSEYAGSFIREEFTNYPALGTVSGTVIVEPCEPIFSTGLF